MSKQLLKTTSTVSLMTFVSRIVGFLRDMVIAHFFGVGVGIDAFFLAFKIPNFLRRLFAEGAFSQAFVPVLSEYRMVASPTEVKDFISKVFTLLALVLLVVTLLGVLGAPYFIRIFAPGFQGEDARFGLACQLLPLTFPYLFFIALTAFAGGIQNAYQRFAVPAFTPVWLNISLIMAALFARPYFAEPVEALAWGVLLAGVTQLLFQVPFLMKLALFPSVHLNWQDKRVRRVLSLMVPALIGASVMQINLMVDTIFASFLPLGSLTWLYYSDRLLEFPIGIFGVALATVVLPQLSQEYAQKSHSAYSASLDWALRWVLFIGLPATVGLTMVSGPLLATLFQYGRFTSHDVLMAAQSLCALALGLVCFLAVKILVAAFYARQNTAFPVKVAIGCMLLNIIFNAVFMGPFAHAGLALASSAASFFNVLILLFILLRSNIYRPLAGWPGFICRLLLANGGMACLLWKCTPEVTQWLDWGAASRCFFLLVLVLSAIIVYLLGLWLTGLRYAHMRLESV